MKFLQFFLLLALPSVLLAYKKLQLPVIQTSSAELKREFEKLVALDYNAARKGNIKLNYQSLTSWKDKDDKASSNLFAFVDNSIEQQPTFAKFAALLDNYHKDVGIPERFSAAQQAEISDFLNAVMKTKVINEVYQFLRRKRHPYASSLEAFKGHLKQLWFDTYRRWKNDDSSGFEHVFLGEISRGKLSGLHNWLRIHQLEANSGQTRFDYKGFISQRYNVIANIRMNVGEYAKTGASFFIGTSPEFELAAYTLCLLSISDGKSKCQFDFNGCPVEIKAYPIVKDNKIYVGTSYPTVGYMTDSCKTQNQ